MLARERRGAVAAAAPPDAAERLAARFLHAFPQPPGTVVSGYMPIGDELDPRPLLAALAAAGCRLALPVVAGRGRPLSFRLWRPGDALAARPMGLAEPGPDAPTVDPDVLLVPLLAFDDGGRRIGYGAGYYDMTIAGLRARRTVLAVGVAFEGQRVDRVPAGPWDALLDAVVTEAATRRFAPIRA
ncbi:MAG: 5-formyltetrahydrofolate cyclo-ligase [Alphaproteobacteria bacterium]|nr:5-formyltetrahydrofolate cyclo-ligase [Alphaproteobacteria bacterium]